MEDFDVKAFFKAMAEVAEKYPDFAKQHLNPAAPQTWLQHAGELADKGDPVGLGIAEILKANSLTE